MDRICARLHSDYWALALEVGDVSVGRLPDQPWDDLSKFSERTRKLQTAGAARVGKQRCMVRWR